MKRDAAALDTIIEQADEHALIEFFKTSSEEERNALRPCVERLTNYAKEEEKASFQVMISQASTRGKPQVATAQPTENSARVMASSNVSDRMTAFKRCRLMGICVLMCGTLAQMKKLDFKFDPFEIGGLCELLAAVKVPWLADWVNFLADKRAHTSYQILIEKKLCPPPMNMENYLLGLLDSRYFRTESTIRDPVFLETTIWHLFEIEGSGERSLAAVDKYTHVEENTWAYRLRQLSREGLLPRARLLDASLDALARDFAQFRASWFSRFHEYLEPTDEERAERVESYLKLLSSTIPPTVSFALDSLKHIQKAGRLPHSPFLAHAPNVLASKFKSPALAALSMLETIAAADKPRRCEVLSAAIEGLNSGLVEVQTKIEKLITKYAMEVTPAHRARLGELSTCLSASVKARLAPLLTPPQDETDPVQTIVRVEVQHRPEKLLPTTSSSLPIVPISGLEELVDRASFVLENLENWMELERVYQALVEFPLPCDAASQRLVKPLAKRAEKLFAEFTERYDLGDKGAFILPLVAWLRMGDSASQAALFRPITDQFRGVKAALERQSHRIYSFHFSRLSEIVRLISSAKKVPLLSSPTHQDFVVDPRMLGERIAKWQAHGGDFTSVPCETVIALLRMGFQHREQALEAALDLTGELGAAFRYALGKDEPIGADISLWTAASRARYLNASDAALEQAFPGIAPGAARIPKVILTATEETTVYKIQGGTTSITTKELDAVQEPPSPGLIPDAQLPALLYSKDYVFQPSDKEKRRGWRGMEGWFINVFASYSPHWKEPLFLHGAACLARHTKYSEVADQQLIELLRELSRPIEKFEPFARTVLSLGLSFIFADGRAAAVQAFINGIDTGRLNPWALGESMREIFQLLILPARVRKSLDDVICVSSKHRTAVREFLTGLFQGDPQSAPDQMVKLLELYYELVVENGQAVADPQVILYLKGLPGSGRGIKIAKQILSFK